MKSFSYLTLACVAIFAGCSASSSTQPQNAPVAESYFFPQTNGIQYTYSEHATTQLDTSTYQVKVGGQYGDFTQLLKQDNGLPGTDVLYFYKTSTDRDGVLQCIMSRSGNQDDAIVALKGTLNIGSAWFADDAEQIEATVVAHYDTYLLPGHEQTYEDVVAVKYLNKNSPGDVYVLRFFARDFGLILERSIVGQTSEIANLQLLSTGKASGSSKGTPSKDRNHWFDNNHRYLMAPVQNTSDDDN